MKLNITSGRLSIFLITCIALSNAVVFAKGHSKELFDKNCGHSLILKGGEPAINPATTLPYVFIFVIIQILSLAMEHLKIHIRHLPLLKLVRYQMTSSMFFPEMELI